MILRHHSGLVLLFIAFFTTVAHTDVLDGDEATVLQRLKRDYQNDDPKAYLDQVISYWIHRIPTLIDIAVAQSEKDLTLTVAKRVTQGWSIVIASWKDILSDWVENDRTLGNIGDMTVVYNYGFLFTYGIGFGFPLLLGLPDDTKSCSRDDFLNTLAQYDLQGGVAPLLHHYASLANIQSILAEFELVIGTKLSCIDSAENIESQAVINAVTNLIASMAARLGLESQNRRSLDHVERKLNVNEEKDSLKTVVEETPPSLLPQPPSLIAEKAAQILTSV